MLKVKKLYEPDNFFEINRGCEGTKAKSSY
jgi:hypothetical protein